MKMQCVYDYTAWQNVIKNVKKHRKVSQNTPS